MCGRARCTLSPAQAARAFGFPTTSATAGGGGGGGGGDGRDAPAVPTLHLDRFRPSYNVSPGAYMPVGAVRTRPAGDGEGGGGGGADGAGPVIQCMKWGLVPSFTAKTDRPDHFRMFNARSDSIKEKASFRRLIPKNRCLVAIEGFYEWKKDGSKKQPYYIHFQEDRPLVLAALYDVWKNSEGREHLYIYYFDYSCINFPEMAPRLMHYRMPVILGNKGSVNAWLNDASVKLEEITAPYEGADLVWYPVTTAMGKTSFDGPECIKEVQMGPSEKPISKFFAKKSTAHDQSVKPEKTSQEFAETNASMDAKVDCDESVENQPDDINQQQPGEKQKVSTAIKDEPVTLEPQVLEKPQSIKQESMMSPEVTHEEQDAFAIKRKIEDNEVDEGKLGKGSRSPSRPMKKEKGPKVASDGQQSLLSYFARK
ncbi:hypothetical protein ACP70R_000144 [Stipagrostis hirtigluma subsp. patula]